VFAHASCERVATCFDGFAMLSTAARTLALELPRSLVFGPGCASACATWIIERHFVSVFIVTSPPTAALCAPLVATLRDAGCRVTQWDEIRAEPVAADLDVALQAARDCRAEVVVAIGGGSVMDVAKLTAALLSGRQQLTEVFGIGLLAPRSTPLVCLPTTSGTGSEVSPIAILRDARDGLKKGVISPHLVPDAAFVDPLLTVGMPPAVTAATGIDALTHCIEAYANRRAHPLVDAWALEGIRRISRSLPLAVVNGQDLEARSDVSLGSLMGGLCLGPVNTAAVHALAYPLGSEFDVAHGVSNAVLLPHVIEFNIPAATLRYAQIAHACGIAPAGTDLDQAQAGVRFLHELNTACGIPAHMEALGVPRDAIARMAASAMTVQRLLAQNPREVAEQDARDIYHRAF
jgi:alcohol dehydrogenase class IV